MLISTSSVVHKNSLPHKSIILKGNSGATNHYVALEVFNILNNPTTNTTVQVSLLDDTKLVSTHTGALRIPNISQAATTAHVLPNLTILLLSLGQLADDRCIILLDKHHLKVLRTSTKSSKDIVIFKMDCGTFPSKPRLHYPPCYQNLRN